jgi:hypothetical protein
MTKKVIAVTVYPILDKNSVGLVAGVSHDGKHYSFTKVQDVEEAQVFGAEAGVVANWLNTIKDVTHLHMVDHERPITNVRFQAIDYPIKQED